jgi:hypothetical protein
VKKYAAKLVSILAKRKSLLERISELQDPAEKKDSI